MGYSRETERQNKALKSILRGETPEKKIFVGGVDKEFSEKIKEKEREEREQQNEISEVLKEARTPWFCPECDRIMKKRIDSEYYRKFNKCLDCKVEEDNKIAIAGKQQEHVKETVRQNKLAYIKDLKQSIEEWKNSKDYVEFFEQVRPDGYSVDSEKWKGDTEAMANLVKEAEEHLQKLEESI
jgi:ribosomal protein L37AE/L43A